MSIALAATLAASMTLPTCSWDRPGANPFMGDVVAAVDRYTDIPEPVRAKLKARMETRQYDEIAAIRRDSVTGKHKYASEIRDMHFGQGQVCSTVTRAKWADDAVERGLVYCESGHCILVPTVCRNVSRIKRLDNERLTSAGGPSFQSASGMPAFPMTTPEPVSIVIPQLPGGVSPDPGAGAGSTITGGGSTDNFGPLVPLPGWGGGGGGGGSWSRPPPDGLLPTVPEPGTWLMALLGLAVVVAAARRR